MLEAEVHRDAPPIPPIPEGLRYAAEHGALVLFIGAGVSRLCGSPSWDQFADSVFAQLSKNGAVSFAELEQLKTIRDPRKKLSIATDIAQVSEAQLDYDAILHPTMQHPDGVSVYGSLAAIGSVFVTTNYDKWLDEATVPAVNIGQEKADASKAQLPHKRASYYEPETLTVEKLEVPGTVLHIHGSYLNRVVGFFGDREAAQQLINTLPKVELATLHETATSFMRIRHDVPLRDEDDKLFNVPGDEGGQR